MRCSCCNAMLSDREATVRYVSTGEFADTCDRCRSEIPDVDYIVRNDLHDHASDYEDDGLDDEDFDGLEDDYDN